MRKLQILKTFIDVFWFASLLAAIIGLVFIPYFFISDEDFDIPMKINGNLVVLKDLSSKIVVTINAVAFYVFVFGVFKLRKLLELFRLRIIFEDQNCVLLHQIGLCFLYASALSGAAGFAYSFVNKNQFQFTLSTGFDSFLFTASIGLFFMVLSEVFKIARKAKLENDLTI